MHIQIKSVRQNVGKTQKDFGESLGVSRDTLASYESGRVVPSNTFVQLLCATYNVNENWLRTGNGGEEAMFEMSDDTNISAIATEFHLDTLSKVILSAYVKMEIDKRTVFNGFVKEIADTVMKENAEKARIEMGDVIINSSAPESVKLDLSCKATAIFAEAFPYIGVENVDEAETHKEISDEEEKAALHAKLDEELSKEKKQDLKVSSVKELDVG